LIAQVLSELFNIWFKNSTKVDYFWYIAIGEVVVILPLCYLRDIKVFTKMHIVGDIAVLCTVFALGYNSIYDISQKSHFDFGSLKLINNHWYMVLGMCLTALEGVGVLLPLKVFFD